MVVGILAHILQVVVLAAGADALLRVGCAAGLVGRVHHAQEVRHKLVHAGVCEQQARALRHQGGGRHDGVLLLFEEIKETLADLRGGHHNCRYKVKKFAQRIHRPRAHVKGKSSRAVWLDEWGALWYKGA